MKKFEEVKSLIAALEADADKFYNKGNSAAGTRIRKGMQDLKNLAQAIRLEVQDTKNKAQAHKDIQKAQNFLSLFFTGFFCQQLAELKKFDQMNL